MNKIKSLYRRLKYRMKHDYLTIENVVLVAAMILCLVWTYQSVVAMSRNWELSERLTTEKKTLELLNVEIEASQIENEYYKSNEYQELVARKQLDKKLAGENMVIMPENSEIAKNKHQDVSQEAEERQYSNFEKWMRYLFPSY